MAYTLVLASLYPLGKQIAGDEQSAPNNPTSLPVCAIPNNMTYDDDPDTITLTYTSIFMVPDILMALALTAYPILRFAHNQSADFSSFRGILIEIVLLWACYEFLQTCVKPEFKDHCNIAVFGMILPFFVVNLTVFSFRGAIRRAEVPKGTGDLMNEMGSAVIARVAGACYAIFPAESKQADQKQEEQEAQS